MTSKTIATGLYASFLAIAVSAPAVAQDQRDQARAHFEQADVNKDGQLDLAEFTTFINLNAEKGLGQAPMIRRFGRHATAFGRLDANKDGLVSREEIAAQAQKRSSYCRRRRTQNGRRRQPDCRAVHKARIPMAG